MKVLLTGANGFVGSQLRKKLDADFTCLKIRETADVKIPFGIDAVIHLSALVHDAGKPAILECHEKANSKLTQALFTKFLHSDAKKFIFFSSVKACADKVSGELTEDFIPNPQTAYGKSKLQAEQAILSLGIPSDKQVFMLRPCITQGEGNVGNMNLLAK